MIAFYLLPSGRRIRCDTAGRLWRAFSRFSCGAAKTIVCDTEPSEVRARRLEIYAEMERTTPCP